MTRKRDPSPFAQPSPQPEIWLPGECQVCGAFGLIGQYWPSFTRGRFLEICKGCLKLGDEEIQRRMLPQQWNGAAV